MTGSSDNPTPQLTEAEAADLLRSLLQKQGTWIDWGKACQQLQRAGYKAQQIFEETGFQAVHQNQTIVAMQVYESLVAAGASEALQSRFRERGSDVLYELRVLNQTRRLAVAQLAAEKNLDLLQAREVARAVREFERLGKLPEGFEDTPGDALAYQCWRQARQKKDLQERSRLIAQGLQFASSPGAREKVEKLLTDFSVFPARPVPLLPIYRWESGEELPRAIPLAGKLPLTPEACDRVPPLQAEGPFGALAVPEDCRIVVLPGWQVSLALQDPVAVLCARDRLPNPETTHREETEIVDREETVLVVIERAEREWNAESYFAIAEAGSLAFAWFGSATDLPPEVTFVGRVVMVLRPRKIFDEEAIGEIWQIDE